MKTRQSIALFAALLLPLGYLGAQSNPSASPKKLPPTPEQQAFIDKDTAIPTDQPSMRFDVATGFDGAPNPKFGQPLEKFTTLHAAFLERRKQPMDVLFLGDSITAGWEGGGKETWNTLFAGPYRAASFGVGGDRTQHVLWRIKEGELDGIQPKAVVLLIGTNNSARNTPEEIAKGVTKIVEEIKAKLPTTKIVLLNLLPRSFEPDGRREVMIKTNEILKNLDNGKDVFYLHLWEPFLDEKKFIKKDLMPDGLHPNAPGYVIMGAAIKAKLEEVLSQ